MFLDQSSVKLVRSIWPLFFAWLSRILDLCLEELFFGRFDDLSTFFLCLNLTARGLLGLLLVLATLINGLDLRGLILNFQSILKLVLIFWISFWTVLIKSLLNDIIGEFRGG